MKFAVLAVITLATLGFPPLRAQENVYDEINAAWEKRNKAVRTAEFEIKCEAFYSKGSISAQFSEAKSAIPEMDTKASFVAKYYLDGNRARIETSGVCWDGKRFSDNSEAIVFNSDGKRSLEVVPDRQPYGKVQSKRQQYFEVNLETFFPITACLRGGGSNPMFSIQPHHLVPAGNPTIVGGKKCNPFRLKSTGTNDVTYWLSENPDWLLQRRSRGTVATEKIDMAINYSATPLGIAVPLNWEVRSLYKGNSASVTKTYTVVKYAINEPIKDHTFELEFPIGAIVSDDTWSSSVTAVVQANGEYQPHPDTPADQLLALDRNQRAQRWTSRNSLLLWIGGSLVFTGMAIAITRRLRRWYSNKDSHSVTSLGSSNS